MLSLGGGHTRHGFRALRVVASDMVFGLQYRRVRSVARANEVKSKWVFEASQRGSGDYRM